MTQARERARDTWNAVPASGRAVHYGQVSSDSEPCLSGATFLKNVAVFRRVVGDESVDRAFEALTEEQRASIESAVPAAWIPVTTIDAFYKGIAREAGQDLWTLYPEIVRVGIAQTLRSVWRALLYLTTDRALLKRTPLIYRRGHSVGRLESTIHEPGRATVALYDWPGMPDLRRVGVAAGIRATLDVAGRKNVNVNYKSTDDGAIFDVRWDA